MTPSELSNKAEEIARDTDADAVVIVLIRHADKAAGEGCDVEHGAYLKVASSATWPLVTHVLEVAAEDILRESEIEDVKPS